jgi:phosphoribosylformylglycinamidine synthase
VSDGGLAVALAESCTPEAGVIGATVDLPAERSALDALAALFGEGPSRIVVTVRPEFAADVIEQATRAGVRAVRIGATGGPALGITIAPLAAFSVSVRDLRTRADACLAPIVGD